MIVYVVLIIKMVEEKDIALCIGKGCKPLRHIPDGVLCQF